MSADIRDVALDATHQINAVLEMIARENGRDDFEVMLKAVLPRLIDLNAFVMSMLDADGLVTPEMVQLVNRRSLARKAVQS